MYMMDRRLLTKRIFSDSLRVLKTTEDDDISGGFEFNSRSRSDSLPDDSLLASRRLGRRRQSLPTAHQGIDNTEKLLQEGILKLQSSARNLDSAKKSVQDILESRRPSGVSPSDVQQFRGSTSSIGQSHHSPSESSSNGLVSKISRWMKSKWEDKVVSKSAEKDVKKAVRGVEEAGEVINQMEDSLLKTEEELRARALALRRQSADAFKLVSTGIKNVQICYDEEEEEEEEDMRRRRSPPCSGDVTPSSSLEEEEDTPITSAPINPDNYKDMYSITYEQEVTNL